MLEWLKAKSADKKIKSLGQIGEEAAQEEYKKRGFKIIAQNEYNKKGLRLGEIDFIATNNQKIVFIEVKTRSITSTKFGSGAEAVNQFKQIKILKAVKIFLQKNQNYQKLQPQIDVCVMEYNEVDKSFEPAKIIANAVEDWN